MSLPLVALVGRPNVGKSSLFNRFLKKRLAIVDETPGVTRDRNYSLCEWNGRQFYLIDTGGIIPGSSKDIDKLVLHQAEIALDQADVVVFIVECPIGPDQIDEKIARELNQSKKKTLLLANKADREKDEADCYQFLRLGLGEPLPVSATVGRGIGEALDAVAGALPPAAETGETSEAIRIAVIGRPNVGKSLFINRLNGQERVIVSSVPGTTRDAVDTPFVFEGRQYVLVDTAGIRRKAKISEDIEYYTVLRTLRAIENCHVALVLIDASRGLNVQDIKVIEDAVRARRATGLIVNKWDLIEKDQNTADVFSARIKEIARTVAYLPITYVSALTGQRVMKTIPLVDHLYKNWTSTITTSEFNRTLQEITAKQPPAAVRGKYIKLLYGTQVDIKPPSFLIFSNYPELIKRSYIRFIENQLRRRYDFEGVPIRIRFRKK